MEYTCIYVFMHVYFDNWKDNFTCDGSNDERMFKGYDNSSMTISLKQHFSFGQQANLKQTDYSEIWTLNFFQKTKKIILIHDLSQSK